MEAADFDISIPSTLRRTSTLSVLARLLLAVYGITLVSFALWFIWFLNGAH